MQKEILEKNAQIINTFFSNDPISIGDFIEEMAFLVKRLEKQAQHVHLKKRIYRLLVVRLIRLQNRKNFVTNKDFNILFYATRPVKC